MAFAYVAHTPECTLEEALILNFVDVSSIDPTFLSTTQFMFEETTKQQLFIEGVSLPLIVN